MVWALGLGYGKRFGFPHVLRYLLTNMPLCFCPFDLYIRVLDFFIVAYLLGPRSQTLIKFSGAKNHYECCIWSLGS